MRLEIIGMLTNIVNEDVMAAFIKRLDLQGVHELLAYVDRLDESHKRRWIKVFNSVLSFSG